MYLFIDLLLVLRMTQIHVLCTLNIHNFNIIGGRLLLVLLLDYGFHLLNILTVEMVSAMPCSQYCVSGSLLRLWPSTSVRATQKCWLACSPKFCIHFSFHIIRYQIWAPTSFLVKHISPACFEQPTPFPYISFFRYTFTFHLTTRLWIAIGRNL